MRQRVHASETILEAIRAVGQCCPHGRDYQTAPEGEFAKGVEIHIKRLSILDKMLLELTDETYDIMEQK